MEQMLTFDDGATTTLESWGTAGPPVICVHGITSSRRSWERTALALEGSYRIFAYDQRGHGDAADVRGPMTLERSLADLADVARAVGAPAALLGHSWGGAVVLLGGREAFATRVVAVDPMIYVPPETWRKEYLDDVERDLAMTPAARETELRRRLSSWHDRDLAGKLHAVKSMRAEAIRDLGEQNRVDASGWDLRRLMIGYPKPLLVFAAGPGESVMSDEDLDLLGKRGGENVEVVRFADQGHNLHRTDFNRYIEATKAFLANG
ncbi:MAG TPA: alpha/beta hydrolase [Candidatus Acidoferrales bacterium]|nr:alpha/beta hydrolase [Candidatus Acidoferrales bacterium]